MIKPTLLRYETSVWLANVDDTHFPSPDWISFIQHHMSADFVKIYHVEVFKRYVVCLVGFGYENSSIAGPACFSFCLTEYDETTDTEIQDAIISMDLSEIAQITGYTWTHALGLFSNPHF